MRHVTLRRQKAAHVRDDKRTGARRLLPLIDQTGSRLYAHECS